jgi:hypothetical protein
MDFLDKILVCVYKKDLILIRVLVLDLKIFLCCQQMTFIAFIVNDNI